MSDLVEDLVGFDQLYGRVESNPVKTFKGGLIRFWFRVNIRDIIYNVSCICKQNNSKVVKNLRVGKLIHLRGKWNNFKGNLYFNVVSKGEGKVCL